MIKIRILGILMLLNLLIPSFVMASQTSGLP